MHMKCMYAPTGELYCVKPNVKSKEQFTTCASAAEFTLVESNMLVSDKYARMYPGQYMVNGNYRFEYGCDGNLMLKNTFTKHTYWDANITAKYPGYVIITEDGYLKAMHHARQDMQDTPTPYWTSSVESESTNNNGPYTVALSAKGALMLTDKNNAIRWAKGWDADIVPTPPAPPPRVPKKVFTIDTRAETSFTDDGRGNAVYLDQQYVSCGNKPMNQFTLVRDGGGRRWQYKTTCSQYDGNLNPYFLQTNFGSDGRGEVAYLDQHNVDCGMDGVLAGFQLKRNVPHYNMFRYEYVCQKPDKILTCREVQTPVRDGFNTHYLDQQNVQCNADEALSMFHLQRASYDRGHPDFRRLYYRYRCCK